MTNRMRSLAPRKVTLEVANEIRKKQENPLIGEWRMHAALLQEGIKLSPRTRLDVSWQKIVPYMDGTSPKPHPSPRKRCLLKPRGATSTGR